MAQCLTHFLFVFGFWFGFGGVFFVVVVFKVKLLIWSI